MRQRTRRTSNSATGGVAKLVSRANQSGQDQPRSDLTRVHTQRRRLRLVVLVQRASIPCGSCFLRCRVDCLHPRAGRSGPATNSSGQIGLPQCDESRRGIKPVFVGLPAPTLSPSRPRPGGTWVTARPGRRACSVAAPTGVPLSQGATAWAWRHRGRPYGLRTARATAHRADVSESLASEGGRRFREVPRAKRCDGRFKQPYWAGRLGPNGPGSGRTVGVRARACGEVRGT
jgi:hypothetical protein